MALASQRLEATRGLVPLRHYVCLPGDPLLAARPGAVVAVQGELSFLEGASNSENERVLVSEICAAADRWFHPLNKHVPCYSMRSPATRRYVCCEGDPVVATILRRVGSQCYQCYIDGHYVAYLDTLAFDGATKKSYPRLEEGDIVYAYVKPRPAGNLLGHTTVNNRMSVEENCSTLVGNSSEVQLSCVAAEVGLIPNDWTSGKSVFGPLRGGRVLTLPLPYVRGLVAASPLDLIPASNLISAIGARVPFKICTGANGRVWVKGFPSEADQTAETRRTVAVCACLTEAQYDNTREEIDARVEAFFPQSCFS
ncbi:unnamed protein product [Phytomonas sp. EM1]|nr:unnamed protein product [Phytomonas sp. EM1]|eukprot:CCW63778.1 unnamed protein product [Phytomonas sp. isolate EM1]